MLNNTIVKINTLFKASTIIHFLEESSYLSEISYTTLSIRKSVGDREGRSHLNGNLNVPRMNIQICQN